jgi:hypothetical protein
MSKQLIEAILALKNRVEALEQETADIRTTNQNNVDVFNKNLDFIGDKLEEFDAKLQGLATPTVVDTDGVITDVAGALVAEFDTLKVQMLNQVKELKGWFHVHLDDHAKNGGHPSMLTGRAFDEAMKNMEGPTL